jgi:hypothetical protein
MLPWLKGTELTVALLGEFRNPHATEPLYAWPFMVTTTLTVPLLGATAASVTLKLRLPPASSVCGPDGEIDEIVYPLGGVQARV